VLPVSNILHKCTTCDTLFAQAGLCYPARYLGGKLSDWSFFVWREGIFNTSGQSLEGSEVIGQGFEDLLLGGIFVGEVLSCSCTCWGVVVCGVGSYAFISLN